MIGSTVGRYRIVEKIGQGGMGEVYLAEDTSLRRNVALKFLPEHRRRDELAHKRFVREAESAAALEHPYICNIKEVSQTDAGQDFIVMEYVEGQTLAEKLSEEGPLAVDEAIRICAEVADALQMAHGKNIVHRDLKPANIMLTPQGHAKVMDFGLAKRVVTDDGTEQDLTSGLTREGTTLGTPAYMSPEQIQARPVDHRSDLFSLGIILYETLTGAHPFLRANSAATMAAILHEEPEALATHLPGSTERLQETVTELLAKDPDQRMQTVDELTTRLTVISSGQEDLRLMTFLRSRAGRRFGSGLVAVVALVLAGLWAIRGGPTGAGGPVVSSLVVLPLANLSGDPEQEYFVDGMTEALITDLSKIGALKVISRSSAMRYRDTDKPIPEIARELGVEAVVEGSVLREADQVRVTAQLIEAATQQNLWADRYERDMTSILALQGEVAQAIAREIHVTLTPGEEILLTRTQPVDPEAYDAYLKGSYHWKEVTPEDFDVAQQYFELALEKDPSYAPAYAGIAWVWSARQQLGFVPPSEAGPRVKEAARRAIELDESSSEAHEALALAMTWTDWDWAGAGAEWERALELNPNAANAHAYYAHFLAIMGRSDEAVSHSERALELDPFNALFHGLYAMVLCFERRWDDAMVAAQTALDQQPLMNIARGAQQYAFIATGMREEQLEQQRQRIAQDPGRVAAFEQGLAEGGYEGAQRAIADTLAARYERGAGYAATGIALRYLDAGDYERAIDWLQRAYEDHSPSMPYLGLPVWEPLRPYPRFQELMRRMGFPEEAIAKFLGDTS